MSKVESNKFEIIHTISVFAIFLDSINYEKWKMLIKHIFEQTYFVKLQAGNKIISTNEFKSGRLQEEIAFFIADSAELNTALLSTVRVFVTGVTSHISHIYKGINAMLIIRGPIKPCIS